MNGTLNDAAQRQSLYWTPYALARLLRKSSKIGGKCQTKESRMADEQVRFCGSMKIAPVAQFVYIIDGNGEYHVTSAISVQILRSHYFECQNERKVLIFADRVIWKKNKKKVKELVAVILMGIVR